MKNLSLAILLLLSGITVSCNKDKNESNGDFVDIPEGYTLVWSDEFKGSSIDLNNWDYETGKATRSSMI